MKRLNLLLIAVLLVSGLTIPLFTMPEITLAANITFNATSSDCYFAYESGWSSSPQEVWDQAHDDLTEAPITGTNYIYVKILRDYEAGDYSFDIQRSLVYFNTSALPDDANITSAVLQLYKSDFGDELGAWSLQVQSGLPDYPHIPPTSADYGYSYYSGDGGSIASADLDGTGYRNITLNTTGISWISLTGVTKFMLRDATYDIADAYPVGTTWEANWFSFYTSEQGAGYRPQLIVTYEATEAPTITTNAATYITTAIARLNAYLDDDGGEACDIRFQYGNATGNYTVNTSWVNDTYVTGNSPYANIASLTNNVTYYFRVQANNDGGLTNGSELNFTTDAIHSCPTNLVAYPSSHSISLSWIKGNGTTNTMIRGQVGSYPTNYTEGNLVYNSSMSTATHSGLTPGTTYYYRAWGESGGNYTANYTSAMATTTAGAAPGDDPDAPTMPSLWYGAPDHTRLSGVPFYSMVNDLADAYGMPPTNFWLLLFLFGATLMGLFIYAISHSAVGSVFASGVTLVVLLNSLGGLLWIIFAVGIIATGIFMAVRRT